MRVRHWDCPLPRWAKQAFPDGDVAGAWELSPPRTSIKIKLVVFKDRKALHRGWVRLGTLRGMECSKPGKKCSGFVAQMWKWIVRHDGAQRMEVDPRYSAWICLMRSNVSLEVVAHECLHAALAHHRRLKRDPEASVVEMEDEESVAYPLGWLVASCVNALRKEGWLS